MSRCLADDISYIGTTLFMFLYSLYLCKRSVCIGIQFVWASNLCKHSICVTVQFVKAFSLCRHKVSVGVLFAQAHIVSRLYCFYICLIPNNHKYNSCFCDHFAKKILLGNVDDGNGKSVKIDNEKNVGNVFSPKY